jgi:hypothetical protein
MRYYTKNPELHDETFGLAFKVRATPQIVNDFRPQDAVGEVPRAAAACCPSSKYRAHD